MFRFRYAVIEVTMEEQLSKRHWIYRPGAQKGVTGRNWEMTEEILLKTTGSDDVS